MIVKGIDYESFSRVTEGASSLDLRNEQDKTMVQGRQWASRPGDLLGF